MINILIALVGTAMVAYTDFKTGYMPDKITHPMIALGIIYVAFSYPLSSAFLVYTLGALVFLVTFITYMFGQFGGGDVKLFTALTLLLPYYPKDIIPYVNTLGISPVYSSYPFILSIFLLAGLIGPLFITSLNYYRKVYRIRDKIDAYRRKFWSGVGYALLISPLAVFYILYISPALLIVLIPLTTALLFFPFKNDILKHFSAIKKSVSKLNDDDVIALELLDQSFKKKLGLKRKTYTNIELRAIKEKARKAKISTITVYEYLPKFGPYIFISLILSLIFGDLILYLLFNF